MLLLSYFLLSGALESPGLLLLSRPIIANNNIIAQHIASYYCSTDQPLNCSTDTGPSGSGDYLTRFPTRSTCCGHSSSTFPYTASVFDTCLADFANHWGSTAGGTMNHGFWFDASGQIKVMMVQGGE